MKPYYVYLLRCEDDSLYTGITTDVERRLREHREGSEKSKYTRSRKGLYMAAVWMAPDRSAASRLEYRLKRLPKEKKEQLTKASETLAEVLPESAEWDVSTVKQYSFTNKI